MSDQTASSPSSELDTIARLRDLIKGIRVAVLTTEGADRELHSRPMYAQQTETDGDLWFATSRSSSIGQQLRDKARILATFSNPDDQRYVVVRGRGFIRHDSARIEALWNPAMKAWFPAGPTDPDLVLIRVEAEHAEYWDSPAAPVRWIQFVTALATGSRPKGAQHEALDLHDATRRNS